MTTTRNGSLLILLILALLIGGLGGYTKIQVDRINSTKFAPILLEARTIRPELRAVKFNSFLDEVLLPKTRKYGIPDALVASQWAIESGRKVNKPGHNYFGLGPGMKFKTLDEAVKVYYRTLKNILAKKGYHIEVEFEPYKALTKLQEGSYRYEGHSDKPYEYITLVSSTPEWRHYTGRN